MSYPRPCRKCGRVHTDNSVFGCPPQGGLAVILFIIAVGLMLWLILGGG